MTTVHGGLDRAELRSLGLHEDQVLDFSSNINPLGTSRRVREAAAAADLAAYPDRDCLALREALAARLDVDVDRLLIGNGSTELIHLLARARLGPNATCLIFSPAFGEYEAAATLAGADVRRFEAEACGGFRWRLDRAEQLLRRLQPDVVFLCNPNNPTGRLLDRESVRRIQQATEPSGLLVLDDAYMPFADQAWDAVDLARNGRTAILRSMTKDHALAGLRLGYLLGPAELIDDLRRYQPPWSVSAPAIAAGLAALEDQHSIDSARAVIAEARTYLYEQFAAMDLEYTPASANFMLVNVGDARDVRARLLRRGIAVRDCASFGLPGHIRVAVRRRRECAQLIAALGEALGR